MRVDQIRQLEFSIKGDTTLDGLPVEYTEDKKFARIISVFVHYFERDQNDVYQFLFKERNDAE